MNRALKYQILLQMRRLLNKYYTLNKNAWMLMGLCLFYDIVVTSFKVAGLLSEEIFIENFYKTFCKKDRDQLKSLVSNSSVFTEKAKCFWWNSGDKNYELRLRFLNVLISFYNPRNKRELSEIINKYLSNEKL